MIATNNEAYNRWLKTVGRKIREKLTEKSKGNEDRCPVCKGERFLVSQFPMAVVTRLGLDQPRGADTLFAIAECDNCGYSQFFNLATLGITAEDMADGPPELNAYLSK